VFHAFKKAGYPIAHLDNTNTKSERELILKWFHKTPNAIITSVSILTTGFDEPTIEAIILNRATKSLTLYYQMIGRGSRVLDNKNTFDVIDLGNNFHRFGPWGADLDWQKMFRAPDYYLNAILSDEDIQTEKIKGYPEALKLIIRKNLFLTDAFKNGLFEIQDASSQLVAPFLQIEDGMKICDVCAGAGGKTLHLSALSENKGQIIAMDIYKNKLHELKRRAKRNSAFNIETRVIENNKPIKRLYGKIDRLLIDSPCSGLGVLKRNPGSKWNLSLDFLEKIRSTQQEILKKYAPMIKKDGKLVYATCSILPSENEQQIDKFLKSDIGKVFMKEDEKKISPNQTGFDGFYMARLSYK